MSNPFAGYGARATSTATPRLVGVIKTRAEAKQRYVEIVEALHAAETKEGLDRYITSLEPELIQFRTELEFFWEGDGDFIGLQHEIERAIVRLDDGLDYPRHEPKQRQGIDL